MLYDWLKPKATESFDVAQAKRSFNLATIYLDDVKEPSEKIECIKEFIKELNAIKRKCLKGEQ